MARTIPDRYPALVCLTCSLLLSIHILISTKDPTELFFLSIANLLQGCSPQSNHRFIEYVAFVRQRRRDEKQGRRSIGKVRYEFDNAVSTNVRIGGFKAAHNS